ncbi:MAG: Hsp70 family protein, partial [Candidatus Puniceispirillales bacterium]
EIHVLQGERPMAADNKTIGRFHLDGIPPAPRGTPQIEVTFDIDANGIVNVSAKDTATGKEQQIKIQASGGLSDDDIEKMVQDAEANAEEDKLRKEKIEARNQAESLIHGAEKTLSDLDDKVDDDLKTATTDAIAALRTALDDDEDNDAIAEKSQALSAEMMKLGEIAYAQQNDADDSADDDTDTAASDDGVVDAEFTEVDDTEDKKSAS